MKHILNRRHACLLERQFRKTEFQTHREKLNAECEDVLSAWNSMWSDYGVVVQGFWPRPLVASGRARPCVATARVMHVSQMRLSAPVTQGVHDEGKGG